MRGELEKEIGTLRAKAEEGTESGNDDPPTIYDYPAIEQMLDGQITSKAQKIVLAEAQKTLGLLHNMKNSSQQQVDDVIAKVCTELLNDSNAPVNMWGDKQVQIPAYTDAIDSLFSRLRADTTKSIQKRKSIPISQPYFAERYWGTQLDFFTRNLENGDLNFRNQDVWRNMVSDYSPEAPPLEGSQYLFVYNGELLSSEDLGNMVYGYYWTGFGIPKSILYLGAGIVSIAHDVMDGDATTDPKFGNGALGDDISDRAAIDKGVSMFLEGK